jgi:hypothetical protein
MPRRRLREATKRSLVQIQDAIHERRDEDTDEAPDDDRHERVGTARSGWGRGKRRDGSPCCGNSGESQGSGTCGKTDHMAKSRWNGGAVKLRREKLPNVALFVAK